MTRATKYIGGKYITKEMVDAMARSERECIIDHISVEHIGGQEKLVLWSDKHELGLPLNTTRIEQLIDLHDGIEETDDWRGTPIRLGVDATIRYQGKRVGGVVIYGPE